MADPRILPIHAATGVGYGEGFAANSHRYAPTGFLPAIKYLVEELGADVNAADHEGNTPLHLCASRGDNECIKFLVSKGADVTRVNREGNTTVDMANGPVQRTQPYPETIKLLEGAWREEQSPVHYMLETRRHTWFLFGGLSWPWPRQQGRPKARGREAGGLASARPRRRCCPPSRRRWSRPTLRQLPHRSRQGRAAELSFAGVRCGQDRRATAR